MYLYAYDVNAKRWFLSPFLLNQFPKLVFNYKTPYSPILVGLPQDGKFAVFLPQNRGELIMAVLKVEIKLQSLDVLVELVQTLYFDEQNFVPFDGKAM